MGYWDWFERVERRRPPNPDGWRNLMIFGFIMGVLAVVLNIWIDGLWVAAGPLVGSALGATWRRQRDLDRISKGG